MKEFYEEIKRLKGKEKRRKVVNILIIVFFSLVCLAFFMPIVLNIFLDLYPDKDRYIFIIALFVSILLLTFAIVYVVFSNDRATNSIYTYLFDYLAKTKASTMHSVTSKDIRKYLKQDGFMELSFGIKNMHTTLKHDTGYVAEGRLINFGVKRNRPDSVKLIDGITFAFNVNCSDEFLYFRSDKVKKLYLPSGYTQSTNIANGILFVSSIRQKPAVIELIGKVVEFIGNKNCFLRFKNNKAYLTIEQDYYFNIDIKKSIYDYQEIFDNFVKYVNDLYLLLASV